MVNNKLVEKEADVDELRMINMAITKQGLKTSFFIIMLTARINRFPVFTLYLPQIN